MRNTKLRLFEKVMRKCHCRVEKKSKGSLRTLVVYVDTADPDDEVGLKIFSITGASEHSFDDVAQEALCMFMAWGVKNRLGVLAKDFSEIRQNSGEK